MYSVYFYIKNLDFSRYNNYDNYVATEVERGDMNNATEKKKMGRPFIGETKKTIMLRIRLSEEELQRLDSKCKKHNKSRSELLRDFINQ